MKGSRSQATPDRRPRNPGVQCRNSPRGPREDREAGQEDGAFVEPVAATGGGRSQMHRRKNADKAKSVAVESRLQKRRGDLRLHRGARAAALQRGTEIDALTNVAKRKS
jgi:hypothetical protein